MKLLRFGISRFRIFEQQTWINIKEPTVLIGPNNEGKTSVCDALNIFFGQRYFRKRTHPFRKQRTYQRIQYKLDRDYPNTITSGRRWPTELTAIFALDSYDHKHLPAKVKKNTELKIVKKWSYDKQYMLEEIDGLSETEVLKVINYIDSTIRVVTIPAIREERNLENIFEDVFNQTIEARLESSRKIPTIKKELNSLLVPEIKNAIKVINKTFKNFLKKPIKIDFAWDISISNSINLEEIKADDGNLTNILLKGDGIKSLMQMALLTQYAEIEKDRKKSQKNIYIIEEPESHLNSSYLYDLKDKISLLSQNSTVILTTHSSIFVNYSEFESNHLVAGGKIKIAKNKSEIAGALGIQLQENLKSNVGAIYLEGYDDAIAFEIILDILKQQKIVKTRFDIIYANSASRVPALILSNKPFFKHVFVLLDNDRAGREAEKEIKRNSKDAIVFITPLIETYKETEMEDLLTIECQSIIFTEHFNRDFPLDVFTSIRKKYKVKWSDWIKRVFNQVGVQIVDIEIVKRILWSKADKIEFTELGKSFLKTMIKSLKL